MAHIARSLAGLALIGGLSVAGYALARGPDMNLPMFGAAPGSFFFSAPAPAPAPASFHSSDEDRPVARAKRKHVSVGGGGGAAFGYGKPVCVRLCDGSFFPTASVTGGDAACAAQCPDAPTALYTMPGDRIEDAVASDGKRYTMLPVAKRYQTSFESTCSCHRESVASHAKQILHDPTLRKGDVVMTANGFRVYEGSGYGATTEKDFVTVSQAAGVPKEERATLAAMERASASTGARSPTAPTQVAARPKGNVTVDNGTPPPVQ